jgi:pilus assembly protein CpaC
MRTVRRSCVAISKASLLVFVYINIAAAQVDSPGSESGSSPMRAAEQPSDLLLTVGQSLVVESKVPIERVSVGFGEVAEASAVSPHEVLLNGKTPGSASLIVWGQGGVKKFFNVKVVANPFLAENRVEAIRGELGRELPGQDVKLSVENETVFLRGTVTDVTSADRAFSIVSTLGKAVNLLYVKVPPPEAQILLKVKFASVDRSVKTQLGLNILSTGAGNTIGSATTQQFSPPGAPTIQPGNPLTTTIADALNLFFFRSDLNLGATIEALSVKGLLQILAEPNMLSENGKLASFLAGGEFPFPSASAGAGGAPIVSIQFREFGVRLTFLPTITPRGTINLQVMPEVSALDFTNGLSVSGFNVPALTTRKLSTQVELNDGQSFAIGGLIDNRTTDTIEKIPFLGDIPILGKFFQSKSVSKQNTELIVIVTPELVRPVPAGQTLRGLTYPTPFLEPNTSQYPSNPGAIPPSPPANDAGTGALPIEKLMQITRLPPVAEGGPLAPQIVTGATPNPVPAR